MLHVNYVHAIFKFFIIRIRNILYIWNKIYRFLFWNDVLNALKKFLAYCETSNSEGILSKSLMLPLHR